MSLKYHRLSLQFKHRTHHNKTKQKETKKKEKIKRKVLTGHQYIFPEWNNQGQVLQLDHVAYQDPAVLQSI